MGLTPARASALSVLVFGGRVTIGQLAQAEQVSAPTMTRLVVGMERDGLVRREDDPADGRVVWLQATAKGARILHDGRRRRVAALAADLATLTPAERETLAAAADILERLLATGTGVGRTRRQSRTGQDGGKAAGIARSEAMMRLAVAGLLALALAPPPIEISVQSRTLAARASSSCCRSRCRSRRITCACARSIATSPPYPRRRSRVARAGRHRSRRQAGHLSGHGRRGGDAARRASYDLVVKPRAFRTRRLTVNEAFVTPPRVRAGAHRARSGAARRRLEVARRPSACGPAPFVRPVPRRANSAFGTRSIFNGKPRNAARRRRFPQPRRHADPRAECRPHRRRARAVFLGEHRDHRPRPRAVLDARAPVGDRRAGRRRRDRRRRCSAWSARPAASPARTCIGPCARATRASIRSRCSRCWGRRTRGPRSIGHESTKARNETPTASVRAPLSALRRSSGRPEALEGRCLVGAALADASRGG